MIANLWSESSLIEKIKFIMFMISVFLLTLAFFFPNAFIKTNKSSFNKQCEQYNVSYIGKFIIINGEAVPICGQQ